jgi:hypothetical protein
MAGKVRSPTDPRPREPGSSTDAASPPRAGICHRETLGGRAVTQAFPRLLMGTSQAVRACSASVAVRAGSPADLREAQIASTSRSTRENCESQGD